jgi:hypothetical protein
MNGAGEQSPAPFEDHMENNTTNKKTVSFREQLEQLQAVVEFRGLLAGQRKEVGAIRAEYEARKPNIW